MSKRPIPPELTKRGITRYSDNLEGREVRLPAGLLLSLFGEELRAHFGRDQVEGHEGRSPARPRDV